MEAHEDDTYARLKAAMEEAEASESPVESSRDRRRRYLAIALVVIVPLAVVSYVAWGLIGLFALGKTDEGPIAVVYRLVGVPGWLAIFSFGVVAVARQLRDDFKGVGERIFGAVIIALTVVTCYVFVGQPLLDVPYLFSPVCVELRDIDVRCVDGSDTTKYYLSGFDDAGAKWEFRINRDTYYDWDRGRTTATVTGLPNTQVTLAIE
ncbi:MAG: hypothetical protein Q4B91_01955 [Atopobiaceae bacterium]|nr:hypothetical protein [Atopobiaceae bacterium]